MAKPKECANCTKQATIHLTQIINGNIVKLDMCEDCAYKKQVLDPDGLSLTDLVSEKLPGILNPGLSGVDQLTCPSCGLSQKDFRKSGRLGCRDCYETFKHLISPVLADIQAGTVHQGKAPSKAGKRGNKSPSQTLKQKKLDKAKKTELEGDLKDAITEERYEDAAKIRDQLRELEKTKL